MASFLLYLFSSIIDGMTAVPLYHNKSILFLMDFVSVSGRREDQCGITSQSNPENKDRHKRANKKIQLTVDVGASIQTKVTPE